jgi:hypothetical protein
MHKPTGRIPDLTKLDGHACLEALSSLSPATALPVIRPGELAGLVAADRALPDVTMPSPNFKTALAFADPPRPEGQR